MGEGVGGVRGKKERIFFLKDSVTQRGPQGEDCTRPPHLHVALCLLQCPLCSAQPHNPLCPLYLFSISFAAGCTD